MTSFQGPDGRQMEPGSPRVGFSFSVLYYRNVKKASEPKRAERITRRFSEGLIREKTRKGVTQYVDLTFYCRFWGCHLSERGSNHDAASGRAPLPRLAKTRRGKVKSSGRSPGPPVSFAWGGLGDGRSQSGREGGKRFRISPSEVTAAFSDH